MASSKHPNEVFTPRLSKVNERMYVNRPDLEDSLTQGLNGSKHLILHGESGSGKSWLYKKMLRERNIKYEVINLANASRLGSINQAFQTFIASHQSPTKTSYTDEKKATLNAGLASTDLSHSNSYAIPQKEPFEAILQKISKDSDGKSSVLVLDNLERIIDKEEMLDELADLITLLDDEIYAEYKVKFIIVGVPNDLVNYFFKTPSGSTVGNRIQEVSEVFRFSEEQTKELVLKGFVHELDILGVNESSLISRISDHVVWVTDRIPQRIHEYCLKLALEAYSENRNLRENDLKTADRKWLQDSLYEAYTAIEASMNEKETKVQRKNQVIYTLGRISKSGFNYNDIEADLRNYFPESTENTQLNVSGILSSLASQKNPLIRKSPKSDAYVFCNPVYRMCIRCMLKIDEANEKVVKRELHTLDHLDDYLY